MTTVGDIREVIYDHFQDSQRKSQRFCGFCSDDDYAAYYTSMYLIQDTHEALLVHRDSGFSQDPVLAYLEYWGVMQAVFIQQDAICELFGAITGMAIKSNSITGAWEEVRRLRNATAGHPAHTGQSKTRAFMGRSFGSYDELQYECRSIDAEHDDPLACISHPVIDLGRLLDRYQRQAAALMYCAYREMRKKW